MVKKADLWAPFPGDSCSVILGSAGNLHFRGSQEDDEGTCRPMRKAALDHVSHMSAYPGPQSLAGRWGPGQDTSQMWLCSKQLAGPRWLYELSILIFFHLASGLPGPCNTLPGTKISFLEYPQDGTARNLTSHKFSFLKKKQTQIQKQSYRGDIQQESGFCFAVSGL